jgi:hypothetical protein
MDWLGYFIAYVAGILTPFVMTVIYSELTKDK